MNEDYTWYTDHNEKKIEEKEELIEITEHKIDRIMNTLKRKYGDKVVDNMTFGEAMEKAEQQEERETALENYFHSSFDAYEYEKRKPDKLDMEKWIKEPIEEGEAILKGIDPRTT